ncbi:MAG TPA: carboxymuconolactone decarboxylase family protein [Dehalococcoidia bacterium]|nr:carboxymuconolactone decarboxylase family protein [Dehalococcoidia bacterium]
MPRLPEVLDKNALPADKRHIHDYLASTRGAVRLPFSAVLNNPELTYRVAHLGSYIRFDSTLPDKVRELAILSAAREVDARFEWAGHYRIAKEAGIAEETIDAIKNRGGLEGLSEDERMPVQLARELLRNHALSDELFNAAQSKYGDAGVVELIGTVGYYSLMGCLLNGLQIEPAADAPQLPR